jgi:hypothetical protein
MSISDYRDNLVSCFNNLVENNCCSVVMTSECNLGISSEWVIFSSNIKFTVSDENVLGSEVTVDCLAFFRLLENKTTLEQH